MRIGIASTSVILVLYECIHKELGPIVIFQLNQMFQTPSVEACGSVLRVQITIQNFTSYGLRKVELL